MYNATKSVEFSLDNMIYRQIDGVAMVSPLGPGLANILLHFTNIYFLKTPPNLFLF